MPNRFTLAIAWLAAAIFGSIGLVLTGLLRVGHGASSGFGWPMLALAGLILVVTTLQLVWPVPLLELTPRGVRLRIRTPLSRAGLVFVPWSRVHAVVVTQTVTSRGARQDAIGFQIVQDASFRVPALRWNAAVPAPEAPPCDVAFAAQTVGGDVGEWVRRIDGFRRDAGASGASPGSHSAR